MSTFIPTVKSCLTRFCLFIFIREQALDWLLMWIGTWLFTNKWVTVHKAASNGTPNRQRKHYPWVLQVFVLLILTPYTGRQTDLQWRHKKVDHKVLNRSRRSSHVSAVHLLATLSCSDMILANHNNEGQICIDVAKGPISPSSRPKRVYAWQDLGLLCHEWNSVKCAKLCHFPWSREPSGWDK